MAVLLFFISAILAISFLIKSRQGCQRHWKTDLILRKWIEFVMITGCRNTNYDLPTDDKRKILHLLIMSVKENFLLRN